MLQKMQCFQVVYGFLTGFGRLHNRFRINLGSWSIYKFLKNIV